MLHSQFAPEIYLEGEITRQSTLSRDYQGPRAVLNALERLATGYGSECVLVQRDLGIAEAQLRDYQARMGKPFVHDAYLSELTALRDQIKAGLSGVAQEPGKEEGPSVSELAERIKALKSAHDVEAAPQRIGQRHSSAEEAITARIRRRTADSSHERAYACTHESIHDSSADPPRTFQERIILERQRNDDGPTPPRA